MKPIDSTSLLDFIFEQMDKLDRKVIDSNQANAQAKLAREANNVLNYGIKRADILLRMKQMGIEPGEVKVKSLEEKNVKADNPYSIIDQINEETRKDGR